INNELLKLHSDLFENIKNLDIDNIVLEQNTCENDK
ncbi:TPA: transcriptional regulator, partial [Campylobacter jejuni]|nr:transcriptional regulator [Campylobacter jejuni]